MIKKMGAFFILTAISGLVFYLGGAVSAASFNIGDWDETARGIIAFCWVFLEIAIATMSVNIDDIIQ